MLQDTWRQAPPLITECAPKSVHAQQNREKNAQRRRCVQRHQATRGHGRQDGTSPPKRDQTGHRNEVEPASPGDAQVDRAVRTWRGRPSRRELRSISRQFRLGHQWSLSAAVPPGYRSLGANERDANSWTLRMFPIIPAPEYFLSSFRCSIPQRASLSPAACACARCEEACPRRSMWTGKREVQHDGSSPCGVFVFSAPPCRLPRPSGCRCDADRKVADCANLRAVARTGERCELDGKRNGDARQARPRPLAGGGPP
jgi:hypothetical protein